MFIVDMVPEVLSKLEFCRTIHTLEGVVNVHLGRRNIKNLTVACLDMLHQTVLFSGFFVAFVTTRKVHVDFQC